MCKYVDSREMHVRARSMSIVYVYLGDSLHKDQHVYDQIQVE